MNAFVIVITDGICDYEFNCGCTGVVGTVLGDLLAQVSTYHFARQRHSAQSMHAQAYAGKGMYEEGLLQDRTGGGKRRGASNVQGSG